METLEFDKIEILKKNYQTLVVVLNEEHNPNLNNFSLHLILTISSGYIKYNKID